MTIGYASLRETVRTQLWPLPVVGVVVAVVVAVVMPHLDARFDDDLPAWVSSLVFGGDAGAARTLLDAISSSLITVTSLTFSLTVVTLQLASGQFSPRLLRTFTSDVFVQATLALFLSTFTYALTLLRAVRDTDDGTAFVPRLSVTLAFLLGVVSVLALVLFLAHLARQIRVETMLREVHADASAAIDGNTVADAGPQAPLPTPPTNASVILAPSSGFMTHVDERRLLRAATELDAILIVDRHPGDSLVAGVPIGVAWSASGRLDARAVDQLRTAVSRAVGIGYERTAAQDVGYGLRQLTDVANKALSPGINDPTTAVHALGHISSLLCQLAGRDLRTVALRDGDDEARVFLRRPGFDEIVEVAISQPRRYAAGDHQVLTRIFGLLEELAWHLDDHAVIHEQLSRTRRTVQREDFDDAERAQLDRAATRVEDAIAGRTGCGLAV
ncbi:DUF2254 domain-containing protein [Mycolicibacterium sp. P1-18]|uniref:DUF2254 domain-containing protein n=1 Tax=Mycolicibacterium sp. P1-18 TaxID=2024615 RepID=UPI0011F14880|nr:DUF2254 domain-containing protein [Mycolicibacterium sp. P1-18]KAA0101381.1 DUF2254 domain-containing protein [Mycolicibacterium sp. P1-18]